MFRILLAAALGALLCPAAKAQAALLPSPARSTVFFTQNPDAILRFEERPEVTRRMVDQLVLAVTGQKDLSAAWRSLVSPSDTVGIKVSAAGGRYFSTHPGVVEALVVGLEKAGVPRSRVIVWDRDEALLREALFTSARGGYAVRGIPPAEGYDRQAQFVAPVLGRLIWGDLLFREKQLKPLGRRVTEASQLSSTSHLATLLSHGITKVINVPVLSDEAGCGVAGALFNMTIPNLDNWRRFTAPGNASASDSIGELYADPRIGGKVVLTVMDGLIAQYAGGPSGNPNYAFAHCTIYASKDPVALDATAFRSLEAWRREANLPPIGRRAEWLATAADLGLGHFAESQIDLKSVTPSR